MFWSVKGLVKKNARNPDKGKEEVEGLGSDLCEWQRVYDEEQAGVRSGGVRERGGFIPDGFTF